MTLAVDLQNFFNYGSVTCGYDEKLRSYFVTFGNGCIVGGGGHEMQTTLFFQNEEELEEFQRILSETIKESLETEGDVVRKTMFDQPDGLLEEEEFNENADEEE